MRLTLKPMIFILTALSIIVIASGLDLHNLIKNSLADFILFMFFPLSALAGLFLIFMYYRTGAVIAIVSLILYYLFHLLFYGSFPLGSKYILFVIAPILVIIERMLIPKKD